jgi:hypothetical protein
VPSGPLSEMGSVARNLHPVRGGSCAADTQISDRKSSAGTGSVAPKVTGAVSRGGDSDRLDRICDLYPVTQVPARGQGLAARVARSASSQSSVNFSGRPGPVAPESSIWPRVPAAARGGAARQDLARPRAIGE